MTEIIDGYTREAGVRNLEREIGAVCRGVAVKVAEGTLKERDKEAVTAEKIPDYLGPQKFQSEVADRTSEPGVATGLAWTAVGGDILFIEATRMPGKGTLVMTGQLGDVMKESAQAALSFVRSQRQVDGDRGELPREDRHPHPHPGGRHPQGRALGRRDDVHGAWCRCSRASRSAPTSAMTGEITLRGLVLPVGGIKEKVLAAHRAGIKRILMPERNRKDMVDVPPQARDEMEFIFIKRMEDILQYALTEMPDGFKARELTAVATPTPAKETPSA